MPTETRDPTARPWLVIVTGEPGSGKSTLGRRLAGALRLPYLSRDEVRGGMLATSGLWRGSMPDPPPRSAAIDATAELVERAAALGISAVLELVVLPDRLPAFRRIEAATRGLLIVTEARDAAARAAARDRDDALLNRPEVLAALGYGSIDEHLGQPQGDLVRAGMLTELGLPTLRVATDDGYDPSIDQIVEWVIDQTR